MSCSKQYCFSHVPIFQNLQEAEFKQISSMITRRTYQRGEYITLAGDFKKKLFIIRRGQVKVVKPLPDGNEQIVRISRAGDFFGDMSLFHNQPLTTNVEAMEETEICMINGEELKALMEKTPIIMFKILEQLSLRIDEMENSLSEISHKDVGSRVASFIIRQYQTYSSPLLSLSKKDMASYLGTTRESVSRKLSQFHKEGYILMDGNDIEVIDMNALQLIAYE